MLTKLSIAILLAAAMPAMAAEVREADYEDFESCYGSFEGAQTVLPKLQDQIAPADLDDIAHGMEALDADFHDLEMRLSASVFHSDRKSLDAAHVSGTLPWARPQNQNLDYWSRNGPMSRFCFDLIKRLSQTVPVTPN